jgi:hypothetical protein
MRIRLFLVLVSAGLVASGFAIQACGSTVNEDTAVDGGGPDVAEASAKDNYVPDAKEAAAPCDTNKDILKDIPDASIADGASSVGKCLGCAQVKCKAELDSCKKDCACQDVAAKALECYAKTQSIACAGSFQSVPKETQQIGIKLAGCVQSNCDPECQASTLADAGDGGDGG